MRQETVRDNVPGRATIWKPRNHPCATVREKATETTLRTRRTGRVRGTSHNVESMTHTLLSIKSYLLSTSC